MYKPGDVVNGHILGDDKQWHPLNPPTSNATNFVGLNAYQAAQKAFSTGYSPHFYNRNTQEEYKVSSPPASFTVTEEHYEGRNVKLYGESTTFNHYNANVPPKQQREKPQETDQLHYRNPHDTDFTLNGQPQGEHLHHADNITGPKVYGYTAPTHEQPNGVSYTPARIRSSYDSPDMWLWMIVYIIPTVGFLLMLVGVFSVSFPVWFITAPLCAFFAYKDNQKVDGGLTWIWAFFLPPVYLILRRIHTGQNQLPFIIATLLVILGAFITVSISYQHLAQT